MGYPKYEEDNRKIWQERQNDYGCYYERPVRQEEYIPYAIRYQLPQTKAVPRKKRSRVFHYIYAR